MTKPTATASPLSFVVQVRTDSGWKRQRGYTTEAAALRVLQKATGRVTLRVVARYAGGREDILAVRPESA